MRILQIVYTYPTSAENIAQTMASTAMDVTYLFTGIILGFSIAAPVGPIGVLCIRRTLASGRAVGFVSGMGAATADALYGSIAAFGLTFISDFLIRQHIWLRLVGGAFLCYLGIKAFLSFPSFTSAITSNVGLLNSYASTFFLTLTNPLTILSFAAIFAGLGLVNEGGDYTTATVTVVGVFTGSSFWWLILSWITSLLRFSMNPVVLQWINRISGLIIFGFGFAAILTALVKIL